MARARVVAWFADQEEAGWTTDYERCERAIEVIGRTPVVVRRTEGKLATWTIVQLRAGGLDVLDAPLGTDASPRSETFVRCWVVEDGLVPPTVSPCPDQPRPWVALGAYGYTEERRALVSAAVGGHVLWAPCARYELFELVAGALCAAALPVADEVPNLGLWRSATLQSALDAARIRYRLTAREAEVMRGVAVGLSNKEIAAQLPVTIYTVRKAACSVYEKLGIRGRAAVPTMLTHLL